jgi:uncharacterized protein (TIGR02996 family)
MDTEQALLKALHDRPTDETSWLVLADWLEENGQPERGEIIRLQQKLRAIDSLADRESLEERIQRLLLAGVRPYVPTITNSIGMSLVLIPPGKFWIGSPPDEEGRYEDEGPRRLIELTKPFYLGVYPVTQAEFHQVMGRNPSAFSAGGRHKEAVAGLDTSRFPVEEVSWEDANEFCKALAELPEEKKHKRTYRLPSEVEWEYACRGGASMTTPFPWGKKLTNELANFKDGRPGKKKRPHLNRPNSVGEYRPNGFGMYDMLGNTWEWCGDCYVSEAYAQHREKDPRPTRDGDLHNARGGTYGLELRRARTADRSCFELNHRDCDCGFRVLCQWRRPRKK